MNKIKKLLPALLLLFLGPLAPANDARAASSSPASAKKAPASKAAQIPDWQQKWDATLAQARQEGIVTIIATTWPATVRTILTQAFKEKYGITLECTSMDRGAALVSKVGTEQKAGLYNYDFFGVGSTTALNMLKPQGLIDPLEPLLILPEIKDPDSWRLGKLPFVGKEKLFLGMAASKQHYIIFNKDLVKGGELTSYKDALKPQFAGKITINDPSTSGSGCAMFAHLALDIWNQQESKDYLRQLLTKQKAVIERDNRIHVESVARGKYAVGLGVDPDVLATFLQMGAPIAVVRAGEGTNVTSGAGGATVPVKMAHPNAGVIFLNWLLTKEGQSLFAKGWGNPSMRADASAEGINSLFLFQPGEKLYLPSEEKSLAMGEWMGISKQIIAETSK